MNNVLAKLDHKGFRDAYIKAHLTQGIAHQIAAMRKQRGWTQAEIAQKMGLKNQSAIARLEDPAYGKLSISTLLKLASVFDVALSTRFQSFSNFLKDRQNLTDIALSALDYETDRKFSKWVESTAPHHHSVVTRVRAINTRGSDDSFDDLPSRNQATCARETHLLVTDELEQNSPMELAA